MSKLLIGPRRNGLWSWAADGQPVEAPGEVVRDSAVEKVRSRKKRGGNVSADITSKRMKYEYGRRPFVVTERDRCRSRRLAPVNALPHGNGEERVSPAKQLPCRLGADRR